MIGFFSKKKRVYLDYASATPIDPRVLKFQQEANLNLWANPSSFHQEGEAVKQELDKARTKVAKIISSRKDQIVFTSGATEANNIVIHGVLQKVLFEKGTLKGKTVITSRAEHSSILSVLEYYETQGLTVLYAEITEDGLVSYDSVINLINEGTLLLCFAHANSELGVINPVKDIGRFIKNKRQQSKNAYPLLHIDASQSAPWLKMNIESLAADFLVIDSQKIYGPRGVGLLYVRNKESVSSFLRGGKQEYGLRPGTENVSAISAFVYALSILEEEREKDYEKTKHIQDMFIAKIKEYKSRIVINGSLEYRIPGNVNISVVGKDAEFLMICLDEKGYAVSTASACRQNDNSFSKVVELLVGKERAESAIRISFGRFSKKKDVLQILDTIIKS